MHYFVCAWSTRSTGIERECKPISRYHSNPTDNTTYCLEIILTFSYSFRHRRFKMIQPTFMLELNHKIMPGVVTIGKYDGVHACLTAATTADKVIIHNPYKNSSLNTGRIQWSESHKEVAILNLSQSITALEAGQLHSQKERDILLIGSPTQLLAYDVQENADLFYKDMANGVSKIVIGKFGKTNRPMALVGGNCSIHGLDHQGNEIFWNVLGNEVQSLILMDYDKDGTNELIVGCKDYTIKIFKEEQTLLEISETEAVIGLAVMQETRFAYSLLNGTVGIYEEGIRLWRVKSKNVPISIHCYDLLGNGNNQLITGWTNGKIDCRDIKSGEVLFKDNMGNSIAGITEGDYRGSGKLDLICVSTEGEVKGYVTSPDHAASVHMKMDQETMRDLFSRKQALLLELKHYESNTKFNEQYEKNRDVPDSVSNMGIIPANTRLQIGLATSAGDANKKAHVEVSISTNNFTVIRAVMIFAEGIFEGETLIEHPDVDQLSNTMDIALYPPRDVPIDIHIKAFVGYADSQQFHVFELTRQLPRFSMYNMPNSEDLTVIDENKAIVEIPPSYVTFTITERMQRICIWINQNFLLPDEINVNPNNSQELHVLLNCLRDGTNLLMDFEANGDVKFSTSNMELAGDLVQSLGNFLNLEHLQTKGHFPNDEDILRKLVESLDDIQETRMRLDTDVAEQLQNIRHLITIADEKRSYDLSDMMTCYGEIMGMNNDLIRGNNIRMSNHQEGANALKSINNIIQRGSRLRIGKFASTMVNNCRASIKDKNVEGLIKTIKTGEL
ncbi:BBSome complex member BBS2-like [Arctopsyche grandis]|uniref:BBSome complex member BBS2-like n=1 Tax=Arctopsyche grandis TaxID=121162 RepID=UPI00406D9570